MAEFKEYSNELDESMDTSNTLLSNWPASMTNGRFVDGEGDFFDGEEDIEGILYGATESREEIEICGQSFTLAQNFFQDPEELNRIFSLRSWNTLPEAERNRLLNFLPNFEGRNCLEERLETVRMLLTSENFKFGNPVDTFKSKLISGKFSPDAVKMTKVLKKAHFRQYKSKQRKYNYTLLSDILPSRKKILESVTNQPVKTPLAILRMKRKSVKTSADFDDRVAKRYFKELGVIRQEDIGENDNSSEDENYPDGPPAKLSSSQKREISLLDSDYWQSVQNGRPLPTIPRNSTDPIKKEPDKPPRPLLDPIKLEVPQFGSQLYSTPPLTTSTPSPGIQKLLQNFDASSIKKEPWCSLQPVLPSTTPNSNFENLLPKVPVSELSPLLMSPGLLSPSKLQTGKVSPSKPSPSKFLEQILKKPGDEVSLLKQTGYKNLVSASNPPPSKPRKQVNDLEVIEEAVANIPGMDIGDTLVEDFDLDFCFEAATAEMSTSQNVHSQKSVVKSLMSPPVATLSNVPECPCFFSLLREKFRSSLDYKMSLRDLEECIADWETQDNSSLSWIELVSSWTSEARSAVAFLSNLNPNLSPPQFVPFLNCTDPASQTFQWIGTGRDADRHLQSICQWWFDVRHLLSNEIRTSEVEGQTNKNLPVKSVALKSVDGFPDFHTQERERMMNPTTPYTYRFKDISVTVGPIRAPGAVLAALTMTPNKGKTHPLLVNDRPCYVTIIVIVRDAVARLRNGEGTRQNICEIVKESQFINQDAAKEDKILTSAVSGALDRLQGENDPCCKYNASKKTWLYLHQGRSEEDFAKMFMDQQGMPKSSKNKKTQRGVAGPGTAQPSPIVESIPTTTQPKTIISNQEDIVMSAVNSILPTEPLQRSELPQQSLVSRGVSTPAQSRTAFSSVTQVKTGSVLLPQLPSQPLPQISVMSSVASPSLPPASIMGPVTVSSMAPVTVSSVSNRPAVAISTITPVRPTISISTVSHCAVRTPISIGSVSSPSFKNPITVPSGSIRPAVSTSVSVVPPVMASSLTSSPVSKIQSLPVSLGSLQPSSLLGSGAPTSASVQVIQVMTSQGLKTFRLANAKPEAGVVKTEASDSILDIQQPLPPQSLQHQPGNAGSILRPKAAEEVKRIQLPAPSTVARLITPGQVDHSQSLLKVVKPEGGVQVATTSANVQQLMQSVQRVIVKDADGKPVQISPAAFQKWIQSRNNPQTTSQQVSIAPSSNIIRVQKPSVGDGSVVQVVQRPVVSAQTSGDNPGQRPTVVKIQGNLSNLSQQQLQTVQLLSSGGASVRVLQQGQGTSNVMSLGNRVVVTAASSQVTATPSSIVSIGGRQYILASGQQGGGGQQVQQQTQQFISTPTSTIVTSQANAATPPGHVLVHTSGGKPIVLSQEQFQQLQNARMIQQQQSIGKQ